MLSPFQAALGADFAKLPEALQLFHANAGPRRYQGRARVQHGPGLLSAVAIKLGGFPAATFDIPITINVTPDGGSEIWERKFGTHVTRSKLRFDPTSGTIIERFGMLTCALSPRLENSLVHVDVMRTFVLGIAVPAKFSPRSDSKEWQDDQGRFCFDIAAYFGPDRLLIRYDGWLLPSQRTAL